VKPFTINNNQSNPLVSVLMTVFNRSTYIADAVQSVINSTYSNWELIIVDDQSTDDSVYVAREYEKNDNRISVKVNEFNLGDYPNRNKAASLASGKYIKYLDADDLLYPHSLEIMVMTMEKFPNAAMGVSQQVYEDYKPYPFELTPFETYKRQFFKRGILGFAPTETIIRTDIFKELGGFTGKRYVGDVEFWLKLSALHNIVKLQSGLVFWRRHEGQEFQIGMQNNSYLINDYLCIINALNEINCPLNKEENTRAKKRAEFRHAHLIIKLAIKNSSPLAAYKAILATQFSFIKVIKSLLPWSIYSKI